MQTPFSWNPAAAVRDHSGLPLILNRSYFVPPPEEIGTVTSAYSALKLGQSPNPSRRRLLVTLGIAVGFAILGCLAAAGSEPKGFIDYLSMATLLTVVFALPSAFVAFLIMHLFRRDYRCDYVGSEGIANYDLQDMVRGKPGHILRFQDATDLKIELTPQHLTGLLAATKYYYSWQNAGKEVFSITGEYYTEKKTLENKFHFAGAAEAAWLQHQYKARVMA